MASYANETGEISSDFFQAEVLFYSERGKNIDVHTYLSLYTAYIVVQEAIVY